MPTVADVPSIAAVLVGASPGASLTHGALTVIPLLGGQCADPGWLTLGSDAVVITEVSDEGSVPDSMTSAR